jgi:hypothetical protein
MSPPGTGEYNVSISSDLQNAFEKGDNRFISWIGRFISDKDTFYFPYKYKKNIIDPDNLPTEYITVLRLAEQYLIRAEARLRQNKILGAQEDLNVIRTRAGLPNTTAESESSLLYSILRERQVELFTEWGHRWFDLVRTGKVDEIMREVTPRKGGSWNSDKILFPIPQSEILINKNLTQNPGY